VLADSGARVCLARPEHAALVADSGVGGLEIVVVERDTSPADHAVPADGLQFPAPGDPSCVIYRSGTTGLPKGVVISWAQMVGAVARGSSEPDDRNAALAGLRMDRVSAPRPPHERWPDDSYPAGARPRLPGG
jgi:acyl-CoA synthetase (AMP-forming)/AMP-acid ligase II